jgi:rhamnosyltransferase
MTCSVIIPTLNAENKIKELALSLNNQSIQPLEIIVIDSSSDDRTVAVASEMGCKTIVIERKDFDHGGTRNAAARNSHGDILVFLTQDALPVNNALIEHLISPFSDHQIGAAFARQIANADANPPEQFARQFNYPPTPSIKSMDDLQTIGIKTFFFSNVCSAIKKSDFLAAGGFQDHMIMNEDMFLAAKLILEGKRISYCPDAIVRHSHNYTIPQYFKRYFDIGAAFNMNNWILDYAKAEGEGLRFIKEQFRYLIKNHHWQWIPYSLILSLSKYAGFKLGLLQNRLPKGFKCFFSLNQNFWNKGDYLDGPN